MPAFAPPPGSGLDAAYAYCTDLVRRQDRDRFLAALFAPEPARRHLMALYAFNLDVARVREVVREALPGEVRLAWWREVVSGEGRGAVEGHPVAVALLDTAARCSLPQASLVNLIEARIFDLYDDPMPTLNDLEGYAGETASALIQLALLVLAPQEAAAAGTAAGHAGVAVAITGLMRAFPILAARGQCFLPLDILARHGGDRQNAVSGTVSPALVHALADLRGEAMRHLAAAAAALDRAGFRALARDRRRAMAPPFLPLALVRGDVAALARIADPFRAVAGLSPLGRQFRLWRAAHRAGGGARWTRIVGA